MPPVRSVCVECEGQVPGQNKKYPDPNGDVQKPVVSFVRFSLDDQLHGEEED
jgi:hypothetical protein